MGDVEFWTSVVRCALTHDLDDMSEVIAEVITSPERERILTLDFQELTSVMDVLQAVRHHFLLDILTFPDNLSRFI